MNILQKTKKCTFCRRPNQWRQFFANQILGEILKKTSILMQNCIEDANRLIFCREGGANPYKIFTSELRIMVALALVPSSVRFSQTI